MEHFVQTNVFARIRTVFARIWTIFAHLIIGCTIRYLKIDNLRYSVACLCNSWNVLTRMRRRRNRMWHFLYIRGRAVLIATGPNLLDTKYKFYRSNDNLRDTITLWVSLPQGWFSYEQIQASLLCVNSHDNHTFLNEDTLILLLLGMNHYHLSDGNIQLVYCIQICKMHLIHYAFRSHITFLPIISFITCTLT